MVQDQMQEGYLTEIYIYIQYICRYRMSGQEQEAWNKPHDRSNWQERTWHHNDPGTLTNEQTGLSEGDNTRWHEWDWLPWKRRTEVSVITPINPNKQTEGKEGRQTSQLGLILIIINKLIGNTLRLLYMDLKFWKNLPLGNTLPLTTWATLPDPQIQLPILTCNTVVHCHWYHTKTTIESIACFHTSLWAYQVL